MNVLDPCISKDVRAGAALRRTNADNIELETTFEQLLLNLAGDAVETDMRLGEDGVLRLSGHGRCGHWGLISTCLSSQ